MSTVKFSVDKYQNFINILKSLKDCCESVSIIDGKIIQMSNDKNILYGIDVTDIFGNTTVYLDCLKIKYAILDIFRRQESVVELDISEKEYVWKDKQSKFVFRVPEIQNIPLKPINTNSKTYVKMTSIDNSKILECEFEEKLINRTLSVKKIFESSKMIFSVDYDIAKFSIMMGDINTAAYTNILEVNEINSMDLRGTVQYPLDMFTLSSESLNVEIGKNSACDDDRLTLKVTAKISGLDAVMYSTQPFKPAPLKKATK